MINKKHDSHKKQVLAKQSSTKYEVGYKKPPVNTQFKKGTSGNPSGRSSAKRNLTQKGNIKATFLEVLAKPIRASTGGKTRSIKTIDAIFLKLRSMALTGDYRALRLLIDLCKYFDLNTFEGPNEQLQGLFDALMAGPVETPEDKKS
jgi:Family of unknown function (DUF5681)